MSLKIFSILVLVFFIGCSSTPVKFDKPVKVDDYKYFVRLKEEKDDPVSKKTFSQKLKESFTKPNKVAIKKPSPPKRRVRKTNTNSVETRPGTLMPMAPRTAHLVDPKPPRDVGKTIMLYLIYLQALIVGVFAYVILRQQKKFKKAKTEKRELNL